MVERPGALPEVGAKLDGFEVWDRKLNAPAGTEKRRAFVSVLASGGFGLNRHAREMWGWEVEAVKVVYDPQRKRVGFIPTDAEDPSGYAICRWSNAQITCAKLMEHYGISVEETVRCYDLEMIDGILVANIGGVVGPEG